MTAETRLAAVASKLTVFERATLLLRADLAGEKLSTETRQILKPDDAEVRKVSRAVFEANNEFWHSCAFIVEWLFQEEIQLGWLRCLDAVLARDATLREALDAAGWKVSEGESARVDRKAKAAMLNVLAEPGHGLERTLPSLWGAKAHPDDDETPPADLETLRERLAFAIDSGRSCNAPVVGDRTAVLELRATAAGLACPDSGHPGEGVGEAGVRLRISGQLWVNR